MIRILKAIDNIITRKLRRSRFIVEGLCENSWVWAHGLRGAVLAILLTRGFDISRNVAFLIVVAVSIFWEYLESKMNDQQVVYGNLARARNDALGDILYESAIAGLVLFL